jgi:hypothetical protein
MTRNFLFIYSVKAALNVDEMSALILAQFLCLFTPFYSLYLLSFYFLMLSVYSFPNFKPPTLPSICPSSIVVTRQKWTPMKSGIQVILK